MKLVKTNGKIPNFTAKNEECYETIVCFLPDTHWVC